MRSASGIAKVTSRYHGVGWNKANEYWEVRLGLGSGRKPLRKSFKNELQAAEQVYFLFLRSRQAGSQSVSQSVSQAGRQAGRQALREGTPVCPTVNNLPNYSMISVISGTHGSASTASQISSR